MRRWRLQSYEPDSCRELSSGIFLLICAVILCTSAVLQDLHALMTLCSVDNPQREAAEGDTSGTAMRGSTVRQQTESVRKQ